MSHENDGSLTPSPDPKPVETPDVGAIVNAAVTSHLKRFTEKMLPTLLSEALKPFGEQLAALKAPAPIEEPPTKAAKITPEFAALQSELETVKKAHRDAEDRRVAAEKKSRDDKAFNDLRTHLAGKLRPEFVDLVANHIFHIEKKLDIAEDGSVTYKATRNNYGLDEEVAYPLDTGLNEWLKSDAAKHFLPASGSVSQTPPARRQVANPQLAKDIDLDKASPQEKLRAADQMADDWAAKLAAAGL